MKIKKNIQKKIDEYAQKRLSRLHANTFAFEIRGCIQDFRNDLSSSGIIADDFEEDELTHSKKLLLEHKQYFQYPRDIALFAAGYLGAQHVYVTNNKTGEGIIFIGVANNIYAARKVFDCLMKICELFALTIWAN